MFCPSCGTENAIGMPYCNRCGANLGAVIEESAPVVVNLTKPILIISLTLAMITLAGFAGVISGAIELSRNIQLGQDPVVATLVVGMLTILGVDFFLVRQLSKLIDASLRSSGLAKRSKKSIRPPAYVPQMPRPITSQLNPGASVTEGTTRFFEPAYRQPPEEIKK